MTTVINNPGEGSDSSPVSMIVGVVGLLVVVVLFFMFVLPIMRGTTNQAVPDQKSGAIDVNVKLPEGGNNNNPTQ